MLKTLATLVLFLIIIVWIPVGVEALCVSDNRANLRKGPGTHFRKLWEVFKYMPFKKIGEKHSWYRVKDLDGDIYWIYKKLVTTTYKCAVVKNEKANFRKGPGTRHKQVSWSPQPKYFAMKVLAIKKDWVHIEDEQGDRAWVHRSLVWIN